MEFLKGSRPMNQTLNKWHGKHLYFSYVTNQQLFWHAIWLKISKKFLNQNISIIYRTLFKTMSSPVLSYGCVICYVKSRYICYPLINRYGVSQSPIRGMPWSVVLSSCPCYPWEPPSTQLYLSTTHGSWIQFLSSVPCAALPNLGMGHHSPANRKLREWVLRMQWDSVFGNMIEIYSWQKQDVCAWSCFCQPKLLTLFSDFILS